ALGASSASGAGDPHWQSVSLQLALHPPWPCERACGEFAVDVAQDDTTLIGATMNRNASVGYGQPLQAYLLRIEGRGWPHGPINAPFVVDADVGAGPHQAHVEDQHLTAQEWSELRVHRKFFEIGRAHV